MELLLDMMGHQTAFLFLGPEQSKIKAEGLEDLLEVYLQGPLFDNLSSKINNYSQNAPLACWAVC